MAAIFSLRPQVSRSEHLLNDKKPLAGRFLGAGRVDLVGKEPGHSDRLNPHDDHRSTRTWSHATRMFKREIWSLERSIQEIRFFQWAVKTLTEHWVTCEYKQPTGLKEVGSSTQVVWTIGVMSGGTTLGRVRLLEFSATTRTPLRL